MKTIRDALADKSMELCRAAERSTERAKTAALEALDGDQESDRLARESRAMASAFMEASKMLDDLRVKVEQGEFQG